MQNHQNEVSVLSFTKWNIARGILFLFAAALFTTIIFYAGLPSALASVIPISELFAEILLSIVFAILTFGAVFAALKIEAATRKQDLSVEQQGPGVNHAVSQNQAALISLSVGNSAVKKGWISVPSISTITRIILFLLTLALFGAVLFHVFPIIASAAIVKAFFALISVGLSLGGTIFLPKKEQLRVGDSLNVQDGHHAPAISSPSSSASAPSSALSSSLSNNGPSVLPGSSAAASLVASSTSSSSSIGSLPTSLVSVSVALPAFSSSSSLVASSAASSAASSTSSSTSSTMLVISSLSSFPLALSSASHSGQLVPILRLPSPSAGDASLLTANSAADSPTPPPSSVRSDSDAAGQNSPSPLSENNNSNGFFNVVNAIVGGVRVFVGAAPLPSNSEHE